MTLARADAACDSLALGGSPITNWSDDPAVWNALTPALSSPGRYAHAENEVDSIVRVTDVHSGAAVLDLGCGAGVHAVRFASRGLTVTAVDKDAGLLGLADAKASELGVHVEYVLDDMRTFVRPDSFDLVCNLNSSFAYFDDDTNARILANIRRSLHSGGSLFLDTIGQGFASLGDMNAVEIGGAVYSVRRRFDAARRVVREDWIVNRGESRQFRAEQRIYTAIELTSMLRAAGFATIALSGSLDASEPYTDRSLRLVAVASVKGPIRT